MGADEQSLSSNGGNARRQPGGGHAIFRRWTSETSLVLKTCPCKGELNQALHSATCLCRLFCMIRGINLHLIAQKDSSHENIGPCVSVFLPPSVERRDFLWPEERYFCATLLMDL